jgi:uncharacterized membrane protein
VRRVSPQRLEAFSDGVLAIAITLLVLDLRLPEGDERPISELLLEQWPAYLAFGVSFAVIGIMWVNHHALFRRVRQVDRTLLFQNLFLLLTIAVLPFPTAVAAEGLQRGGWDAKVAMFVYSVTLVVTSLAFGLVWNHILRTPGLLRVPLSASARRGALIRFSWGLLAYSALCVLAFVSPLLTLAGHLGVAAYYAFEQLPAEPAVAT